MIYDYKSDKIVQDIITDDLSPIIEDIEAEYTKLRRYEQIDIFAPSNIAREILGSILDDLDDLFIHSESHIEFLYNDKNDVCITVGYDGMVFIENSLWDDKNMKSCDGVMNYVYDSFKKCYIDKMSEDENPILVFGLKDKGICADYKIEYSGADEVGNDFYITIKCDLDLDEAFAKLDEMETRMSRINDVFREMDNFRRLFRW